MEPALPFADISTGVDALAGDDDARLAGRAGARLQERRDLHHHALGRDQGAQLMRGVVLGLGLVLALPLRPAPAAAQTPPAGRSRGWSKRLAGTPARVGVVDDAKARTLIETTAFEGNVLARMWLARLYSRGRAGYPRDEARARAIAELLVGRRAPPGDGGRHRGGVPDGHRLRRGPGRGRGSGNRRSRGSARPLPPATRWPSTTSATPTPPGAAWPPIRPRPSPWWLKAAVKGDAVPQLRLGEAYEAGTRRGEEPRRGPPLVRRGGPPRQRRRRRGARSGWPTALTAVVARGERRPR